MAWLNSGRVANPALDQVLIDTGPLQANSVTFAVYLAATANCAVEVQWRDAANTGNVKSQIVACTAFNSNDKPHQKYPIEMAVNERIRVIQVAAVTGSVSVSLDINA